MDLSVCIDRLSTNIEAIRALLIAVPVDRRTWRPAPERWSALEIVNHLLDEEREDFRLRIETVLRDPDEPFAPIDPQGWVTSRGYAEREFDASLDALLEERRRSIAWLTELGRVDWSRAHVHPKLGALSAGDLMASWLAHDLLHIRQILRLRWEMLGEEITPFSADYAGVW
jgi:hypothetical protein